jgi:uncharacterized membrane protein YccF (DUF307 family)
MKFLGNIIWLLFGGLAVAVEYFAGGLLLCLTVIGIPFGLQAFKLGVLAIWPFGREAVRARESDGCLSLFMNVLWFFIGGAWICLTHLLFGLLCCVTIIAIPWGMQHFKLAGLALTPFGREIR